MPKHTFSKMTLVARTAVAAGAALLLSLVLCLLLGGIAGALEDPTAHLTLFGEIALMLSMLFCGFLGASLSAENRFAAGMLASGIWLLLVSAASLAVGNPSLVRSLLLIALAAFCGAVGSLLGAKEHRRRHKR